MLIRLLQNLSNHFNDTVLTANRPTVKRARLRNISLAPSQVVTQRCQELRHHKTITSEANPSLTLALSYTLNAAFSI